MDIFKHTILVEAALNTPTAIDIEELELETQTMTQEQLIDFKTALLSKVRTVKEQRHTTQILVMLWHYIKGIR